MSKTLLAYIKKNPGRVLDWYKDGEGYYDVQLNGLCDEGDISRHIIIDRSVAELIKRIRKATPCTCGNCPTKTEI